LSIRFDQIWQSDFISVMVITTTDMIEGYNITKYFGIVSGEVIYGANFLKDYFAGLRNVIGGRTGGYEKLFKEAQEKAMEEIKTNASELGANGIVGITITHESMHMGNGTLLMVAITGTAVKIV
jgi:uncharacterized protein YbjQ (UPF0145 family)